ncbi:nucleoside diphosphate-linked moiety X motif 19-like isoform X2 [Sipha flava]|uniref:Nucleoside diphosphate-linked moiety X motif 19-like isoform X2 n=1 Tax=Sipha flava TaxID=143950 RepID=A0A8B8FPC9_9HEMI|nr:nucleoside diphosphate-linked moiety X motif 19-like isoform X2 [Sipha flava]
MSFWREASSVILLTKSSNVKNVKTVYWDHFRILCIKRSEKNSFLPNYTVFPGGTTEKSDSSPEWKDIIPDVMNSNLNLNIIGFNGSPATKFVPDNEPGSIPKDLSLRVTAIRETFEESGILLCKRINCNMAETCASANHLEIDSIDRWRKLVQKKASNFIELCNQNHCYPDVGALHLWSNWLTPPLLKTKFDTKFFLAYIESPVNASPDGIETSQMAWSTPDEILSRFVVGDEKLVTPQYYELLRLKQFTSINKLIYFARARSIEGCEQVLPMVIATKDGYLTLLPDTTRITGAFTY